MKKGYLTLILHSHLPFVKHPEEDYFIEENWLYEAIVESYLPLYHIFNNLLSEHVNFEITMSMTPPLITMLQDSLLMERFDTYLKNRISLIYDELRSSRDEKVKEVLSFYLERFKSLRNIFVDELKGDILSGYKRLFESGCLELITSTATHEILPLELNEKIREVQVKLGVEVFKKAFDTMPSGLWLGECAYTEGIDKILSKNEIRFTMLDTHGILYANPTPVFGVSAPIVSESGVVFFGRDPDATKQVWSAQEGYPGDFRYREFYKDIGYDISTEKVKKYLHPAGFRFDSGIKIHRISGKVPLNKKELYSRNEALSVAQTHAGNFMFNREREAEYLYSLMGLPPIIVTPFDTELFGHWWFEGPEFLGSLLEDISKFSGVIDTITPFNYIKKFPRVQIATPSTSTWGDGGYFKVWLNDKTDWIYPHLHLMGAEMIELAKKYRKANPLERRALNQMGRELMLAESSDWAFLISVGTAVEYATMREKFHINAFYNLREQLLTHKIDEGLLGVLEHKDSIFPFLDYTIFR